MFLLTTNPSKIVARLNIVTRLTAVITLLLLPLVVQAQAPTVPSSSNGNYSVTWNAYYMFLEEKVPGVVAGQGRPQDGTSGTNTISFASKACGHLFLPRGRMYRVLSLYATMYYSACRDHDGHSNATA